MKKLLSTVLVTVMVFALAAGTLVHAAASVAAESLDNIFVNGVQLFNGGAETWLAANEVKGKIQTIGIRGWIILGNNEMPSSFGYKIDDGDPVKVADSVVYDQAILDATGNAYPNMRRDVFVADVSGVGLGEHTFTIAAWNEADEVAYGKSFTFTQELAPGEVPPPPPPTIVANNLDDWKYWYGSALGGPVTVFTHGDIVGFHIAGWFGYNYEAIAIGYRINGVETYVDGAFRAPEQAVKDLAGQYARRYDMDGSFAGAGFGVNDFDIIVKLNDDDQTVVDLFSNIPTQIMPTTEEAVYFYDPSSYTTGYWTGPNAGFQDGSDIQIALTAPASFDGVFMFAYASPAPAAAVMNINLYDKDNTLLETVTQTFNGDAYAATKFSKVYPSGDYTLQFVFADGGHFVLGSGTPVGQTYTIGGFCNNQYPESAPSIALIKADLPVRDPSASTGNAALDEFKYDGVDVGSGSLYKWINNPDNREDIDFEAGAVSAIYFRGWAQLNNPISGFGYIIDDGAVVTDASFVQDRTAELSGAGFPGSQGYTVTVPVADLAPGEHTIKVVVIDDLGEAVQIIKTKEDVDYPIALTFTVSEAAATAALVNMSFNTVWVDGAQVCDIGDAFEFLNANPIVDASAVGFRGWAWIKNSTIAEMGYRIDDGEPVTSASFIQDRADVQAAFGVTADVANGFNVSPIDVSGLTAGTHTITIVVKAADGTYVDVVAIPVSVSEPAPEIIANHLDAWGFWRNGAVADTPVTFAQGRYTGFHIAGWFGYNFEALAVGYRINGVETFVDGAIRATEQAVKDAGGEYAVRYDMDGSFESFVLGENSLDIIVKLNNSEQTVVDLYKLTITVTDPATTPDPDTYFFSALRDDGNVSGWWTGPVIGLPLGGTVDFTFTTDNAFNGICVLLYANEATFNVNLFNESGIKIDSVEYYLGADGVPSIPFSKAYAPGTYTIQFEMVDGNYIVVGTGYPSAYEVTTKANGYNPNDYTLSGLVAFLTGAVNPGEPEPASCLNAAFDDLKYDDTVLCSEKAYLWVANEENRAALDFEKATVSDIYMRGWAQLDKAILGFAYRIDGGAIVMDPSFVQDRAAELEGAGFPGAQGFAVTVPVGTLSSGEHTVEVLAIDEDGFAVPVVKVKNEVTYPVAVTFTVSKPADHESVLTNKSFDQYFVDGVNLGQAGTGHVDREIINKYQQVYAITSSSPFVASGFNTVGIYGWAGFDGEYVESFGYKIDDQPSVTSPSFVIDRRAELTNAGFPYGEGFYIVFDYSNLAPGEHTVTFFATAIDEEEHELLTYTFTVAEVGTWLYDNSTVATIGNGMGWWTGYNVNPGFVEGSVDVVFTTPDAFDGVYTIFWANYIPGAVMDVNLYDENDELLETVPFAFMNNAALALKFSKAYEPGTYTLQYAFVEEQAAHFVLGAGPHNDIETSVGGMCNNSGDDTYAPSIGLLKAEIVKEPEVIKANFDVFDYSNGILSVQGWAGATLPANNLGYRIDGGEAILDGIEFANIHPAEADAIHTLAGPDAFRFKSRGNGLELPLDPGEHTITIVVRVSDGTNTFILDLGSKNFTVSGEADPATLVNMSFNTVWADGAQLCDIGDALTFLADNPIPEGTQTVGLRGWAWIKNSTIGAFGYQIDGSEPVFSAEYTQDRADVQAAFGVTAEYANGFNIQGIDVSGLGEGKHIITVVVKAADGTIVGVVNVPFGSEPAREPSKSTGNSALDEFKYDDAAVGEGSLYKWINNPANREEIDFVAGTVSAIYFRGWAQLNNPISGFGYIIDNGAVVTDASFVQDRTAELANAGFPGSQGYTVTVPVADLAPGEHTIKIVVIDDLGEAVQIIKNKEGVDYPIALTFTVTEAAPKFELGDVNKDGEVNNKDVVVLFREVSKKEPDLDPAVADVNSDGNIDNKDVVVLFRMVSTLPSKG